jgi:hypothetical protein
VWLDITLATHGSCPEWLMREHPDIRSVNPFGQPTVARAHPAYPQGGIMHCYDHPAWLEHGGRLLRHVVSRYKDRDNLLLFLPNAALMSDSLRARIERTLDENPQTRLVAEGSFGLYSADGQSSYGPPEHLTARLGVRVADFSAVTEHDIAAGRNVLQTPYGPVRIVHPCGYAVLEPQGDSLAIASLGDETLAIRSGDGRFTWYGMTLSAGFGDVGESTLVLGLTEEAGVESLVAVASGTAVSVQHPVWCKNLIQVKYCLACWATHG